MAKGKVKDEVLEKVFEHDNKYLFLAELNIQFRGGKYVTSNEEEIAYLKALDGVREV